MLLCILYENNIIYIVLNILHEYYHIYCEYIINPLPAQLTL